jgi:hypothetical protein
MRATKCADCDKLKRELLSAVNKLAKLTAAQGEALHVGEESMFERLEDAVQIALTEKQRAIGALRQHRDGHG